MSDPETVAEEQDSFDGYAVPPGRYDVPSRRGPKYFVTLGIWATVLAVGMVILSVVDARVPDVPNRYVCPPDCGRPPTGLPVAINPRFTAADFSVSYPAPSAAYDVTTDDHGVTAVWTGGDGGRMRLAGRPAGGRTAREITGGLIEEIFPDARLVYELPNATVGYQPGYGAAYDFRPLAASSKADLLRIIVVVAVKHDFALIAVAGGPFREFTPSLGPGPPSPANLEIAQDMGKYVNSFMWRGDPPR
jgi:hypothetical protein